MSKKKIILHIGIPKTGTTSIQRVFSQSNNCENIEFWRPPQTKRKAPPWRNSSPHKYISQSLIRQDYQNLIPSIKESYLSCSKDLLISDEALWLIAITKPRAFLQFLEVLSDIQIPFHIVVTFRNSRQALESLYKQSVENNGPKSTLWANNQLDIAKYFEHGTCKRLLKSNIVLESHYNYSNEIELKGISHNLQSDKVSQLIPMNSDIVKDFHDCLCGCALFSPTKTRFNPSLPQNHIELLRLVNIYNFDSSRVPNFYGKEYLLSLAYLHAFGIENHYLGNSNAYDDINTYGALLDNYADLTSHEIEKHLCILLNRFSLESIRNIRDFS